jgi:hypothetical protein
LQCVETVFAPMCEPLVKSEWRIRAHGNGILYPNVKEHATLSAAAHVDHGVEVKTTEDHENRAADRGCVSRLVGLSYFGGAGETMIHGTEDVSDLN